MREYEVVEALMNKFDGTHVCFREVKDGSSWGRNFIRMDFIAIKKTWSPVTIAAVEIKTSRRDFLNDTKWPKYLELCNKFYWACPTGMIKKEEVDPQCGLLYVNPDSKKVTSRKAALHRNIDPDPWLLLYLLLWREDERPKPHDRRKETMRALMEDMKKRHKFGKVFAYFSSKKLSEAHEKIRNAEHRVEAMEHELEGMRELKKFVEESGLDLRTIAKKEVLKDLWSFRRLIDVRSEIERAHKTLGKTLAVIPKEKEEEEEDQ